LQQSDLLLHPKGPRIDWCLGCLEDCDARSTDGKERLSLNVRPGDLRPYASLHAILLQLAVLELDATKQGRLKLISNRLQAVGDEWKSLAKSDSVDDAVMQSNGTVAALRRVSRESAPMSSLIHQAAAAMLNTLTTLGYQLIVIRQCDNLDRPSLKALFRANLLTSPSNRIRWEWQFDSSPPSEIGAVAEDNSDLWRASRYRLMSIFREVLRPAIVSGRRGADRELENGIALQIPSVPRISIAQACVWLGHLNYDACLLWASDRAASVQPEESTYVDLRRLLAIAALNIGEYERALQYLREGYDAAPHATLRAHLAYMLGLVTAKRHYDIGNSDRWYQVGMNQLNDVALDDPGDPELERAWILNGIALNTILGARFAGYPIGSVFQSTYALLNEAFNTVHGQNSPDRTYLRFNLLGNIGTLLEINGEFRLALKLNDDAFDASLASGLDNENELRAHLITRRGSLLAKIGDFEEANRLYGEAVGLMQGISCPIREETLLRSEGALRLRLGRGSHARESFERGLDLAMSLRSRLGVVTHGRGLVCVLRDNGDISRARDVYAMLAEEEGVWLTDHRPSVSEAIKLVKPPDRINGLSMSIPEVDLEELAPKSIAAAVRGTNADQN
jgi:tetratricopeptide (TPR) repeat protein